MVGTFAGIHKFAYRPGLLAARFIGGAMMNTNLDHHGMQFTGLIQVAEGQVGFDEALHLVVRGGQGIDLR